MKNSVILWHTSEAPREKLEKEGLQSKYWRTCIGGQKKGSYFFTSLLSASAWVVRHDYSGKELFYGTFSREKIRYPDWEFDLFFDSSVLKKVPAYLNELYFNQKSKNGYVSLNLNSQMAVQDESEWRNYKFHSSPVILKGIYLKNKKCFIRIEEKGRQFCMDLNSDFKSDYLGVVETLVEHLCQYSPAFQKYYNQLLQKRIDCVSVVKYVGNDSLPLKKDPRGDINCLGLALLHTLRQCCRRSVFKVGKCLKDASVTFVKAMSNERG